MKRQSTFEDLGKFIFLFQHVEAALTRLLVLMSDADDEDVEILVNELEYFQRIATTDVLFARFVDIRLDQNPNIKKDFHNLMTELKKLGERRNELVHSQYTHLISESGGLGLFRQNSRLRTSKGLRNVEEEDLLPDSLDEDLKNLSARLTELEGFRLKLIDWLIPE